MGIEQSNDDTEVEVYAYSGRFSGIIPEHIWKDLIPLQPQARRAYLLRELLRVPLTFDQVFLEFELQFSTWSLVLIIFRNLWDYVLNDYRVLTALIILALVTLYGAFRFTQILNEKSIIEEITFNGLVTFFSIFFAIWVSYLDYFSKVISW